MTEFVNITNINDLANAIRERNAIEKNRLQFEKEMFEFNKQFNASSIKSNEDMVEVMKTFVSRLDIIDNAIRTFANNDTWLKKEIDSLNASMQEESVKPKECEHEWCFYKQIENSGGRRIYYRCCKCDAMKMIDDNGVIYESGEWQP